MNDPLANAYLKVIEEEALPPNIASETKKQVGKTFGNAESEKNAKHIKPKSATENADSDMEEVEEAPDNLTSHGSSGEAKKLEKSSYNNPFDMLYNKILKEEEAFNFSTQSNQLQPDSTIDMNTPSQNDGLEEFDDETEEEGGEEGGEEVSISMDRETAQKFYDLLGGVLSSEEGEEMEEMEDGEEMEELGENEDENEDEVKQEAVEAEVVGHALVDTEKLNKGMNNPSNKEVKGAVPVTKKTAETPQSGKDCDGKLKPHPTQPAISKLQNKNNNTGGVNVGKTLFDN